MVAISRRLRALRRSRGGRPPRSACPALKSADDCAGNAECKWNAKLSKCRKAPAKRSSKKNVSKEQNYTIVVSLLSDDHKGPLSYSQAQAKKIIDWYNKIMSSSYFKGKISDFKIEHVNGKTFNISYKMLGEIFVNDVMDPDDDGNYPIKVNGHEYLVAGKLL